MSDTYIVIWEIEMVAESPLEATQKALKIMRDENSISTVFGVTNSNGDEVTIDLEDLDDSLLEEDDPARFYRRNRAVLVDIETSLDNKTWIFWMTCTYGEWEDDEMRVYNHGFPHARIVSHNPNRLGMGIAIPEDVLRDAIIPQSLIEKANRHGD